MELPIDVSRKATMAENTYLLTLDGDIDFRPNAVQLLVDLMKKNRNLGAACGRIHPVGSGEHTLILVILSFVYGNHLQNVYGLFADYFRTHAVVSAL